MKRAILILSILSICMELVAQKICDADAAKHYCDTNPIDRIEGLWRFTQQDAEVFIQKTHKPGNYVIILINSDDARLLPGDTIGSAIYTPVPEKFNLSLYMSPGSDKWKKNCVATLTNEDHSLIIETPKAHIDISPRFLLSRFWGLLLFKYDDPTRKIPNGLIRSYPRRDAATEHNIIYL